MHHSQDLNSTCVRTIKDEDFFEACYPEDSQGSEFRMFEPGMPSYLGICGKQAKCLMRRQEKPVADFRTRFRG